MKNFTAMTEIAATDFTKDFLNVVTIKERKKEKNVPESSFHSVPNRYSH